MAWLLERNWAMSSLFLIYFRGIRTRMNKVEGKYTELSRPATWNQGRQAGTFHISLEYENHENRRK